MDRGTEPGDGPQRAVGCQHEPFSAGREQRHRQTGAQHVFHGFQHVPVHQRRGHAEDHAGSLHAGRILRRRGQPALQSRPPVLLSGSFAQFLIVFIDTFRFCYSLAPRR